MKKIPAPISMKKQPHKTARTSGRSRPKVRPDRASNARVQSMSAVADALVDLVTSEAFARVVELVTATKYSDAQFRRIARMHIDAFCAAQPDGEAGRSYEFSDENLRCSTHLGHALLQAHYNEFGGRS